MSKPLIIKEIEILGNNFDRHRQLIDVLQNNWHWPGYCRLIRNDTWLVISTGGLSDHEKIIEALGRTLFWQLYWESSKRGGHYGFNLNAMKKQ